jgi:hypothetical protein
MPASRCQLHHHCFKAVYFEPADGFAGLPLFRCRARPLRWFDRIPYPALQVQVRIVLQQPTQRSPQMPFTARPRHCPRRGTPAPLLERLSGRGHFPVTSPSRARINAQRSNIGLMFIGRCRVATRGGGRNRWQVGQIATAGDTV